MTDSHSQTTRPLLLRGSERGLILFIASLGGFLVTFMSSSVNVALPLIESEFHVSAVLLSWLSLSYVLVSAACLLPLGRLADMHGRMRVYVFSQALFVVFSIASGFAPSALVLLVLRALNGIALASGSVTATSLVILAYPPEARGRALGVNIAGVYLGLTLGPVLGGLIIHNLGWRSLFFISGALSLITVTLPLYRLRGIEWREPRTARFDVVGSIAYAVPLIAVLLGFSFLPGVLGVGLIVAGLIGLAGFLVWESRVADPLLNVGLLRGNRVFGFSNVATLINYSASSAMLFLMSLYLQYNRGLNPQTAGFVLVTGTFVQVVAAPFAGRLADRMEARYVATTGMVICFFGLLGLSFVGLSTPYLYVIAMLCLVGLGTALFATPNTHAIVSSVETRFVGVATATIAMMRQAGMSMSIGFAALVLAVEIGRHDIGPADYPGLLTSVHITFLVFTALCAVGAAFSMVGPRRGDATNPLSAGRPAD